MSIRAAISKANIPAAQKGNVVVLRQESRQPHSRCLCAVAAFKMNAIKRISMRLQVLLFLVEGRCALALWLLTTKTFAMSGLLSVSSAKSKCWLAPRSCLTRRRPTHNWASCPRSGGDYPSVCLRPGCRRAFWQQDWMNKARTRRDRCDSSVLLKPTLNSVSAVMFALWYVNLNLNANSGCI